MAHSRLKYLLFGLAFCVASMAWAQGTTSKVTGLVQDPTGAVIPGANVTLTNEATGVSFTTGTTAAGTYVFESVQVGVYTLAVESSGFKKFVSTGNRLTIEQPLTINASLQVGALAEVVEVTESYERVQTSSSGNFGNLVDNRSLTSLPLVSTRGRNPLSFTLYQPGVVGGANTGGGTHVHGARDRSWNFTLDGIDINESSAGGSNFTPLRTNPDSLSEFSVLTGQFTAEYGRNSGGQVGMVTRSGGNDIHGEVFYFYRTAGLDANQWRNNRVGQGKSKFLQHIGGASVGGPIIKDKTFFFFNFQVLRAPVSGQFTGTVYTQEARNGNFRYVTSGSAPCPVSGNQNGPDCVDGNGNPISGITIGTYDITANDPAALGLDPTVLSVIGSTPLPNDFTVGDGLNTAGFTWSPSGGEEQEDFVVKIDHIFSPTNTIFGRMAWGRQDTVGDVVNSGNVRFPGLPSIVDTERTPRNLALGWRTNPSSQMTNEFVFGWNQFEFNFINPDPDFETRPHIILNNVTDPFRTSAGNLRKIDTFQFVDNLSYVTGPHTFKGGVNLRFQQHRDTRGSVAGSNIALQTNFSTGINTVDSTAFNLPSGINSTDQARLESAINDLLGRVGNMSQAFVATPNGSAFEPGGTPFRFKARYPELDFYFQDTWKLRPNLTLDLGLRLEMKLSPSAPGRQVLVPNQPVFAGAPPSDTLTWVEGDLFKDDRNNFSPSIGLAWDPFGNGKTSIRANYRLAYDRLATFMISSRIFQSYPGQTLAVTDTSFGTGGGRLQNAPSLQPTISPQAGLQPVPFSTSGNTVFDPNWEAPQTHMWGLSIQRDLGNDTVVEVSYNGRHGVNLIGAYDVNSERIDVFDPATCGGETFLQSFNTVAAGGTSCLMNALFAGDPAVTTDGSDFVRNNFSTFISRGEVGDLAAAVNRRTISGGQRLLDASGISPFFFAPYPQFAGILQVVDSNDESWYHGAEIQLSRRFTRGLGFQVSYTFAKSLDLRSFDPTFSVVRTGTSQAASSTPWDNFNRRLNKARSDFDRRHALQGFWVYQLPFGSGQRWGDGLTGALERIVGGWEFNGILGWTSGRPFTVFSGTETFSDVLSSTANCSGCSRNLGQVQADPSSGQIFWFNAADRARFSQPAPGEIGNTGRNFFETDTVFNLDLVVGKRTRITESHMVEFRLEMQNATNTPEWRVPTSRLTSSVFGRLLNPRTAARRMQLVLKYHF